MSKQPSTRGRGRPVGKHTFRVELMLPSDVITFLDEQRERDPKFNKSAYVARAMQEKIAREQGAAQ